LRALVAAVRCDNPFYSSRLRNVDADLDSLDAFAQQVPFTTKQEVMRTSACIPLMDRT